MAKFTVLRPFHADGRVVHPGDTVELTDQWLMRQLLAAKRIEPTPEAVARMRSHDFMPQWLEPRTQAISPRAPGLAFRH